MKRCLCAFTFSFCLFSTNAQLKGPLEDMRGVLPGVDKVDREKLMEMLSDALREYPDQPSQYNNLGVARYYLEEYDSALVDFNKTIELSPHYADAYFNRGLTKLKLYDYAGAIEDFKFIIKNDEKDFGALYNTAVAKYYGGWREDALADLEKAVAIAPDLDEGWNNMAVMKMEIGKELEAIEHLTKAITINGVDADYYYNRGRAYRQAADLVKGCDDLKKAAAMGHARAGETAKSCE